MSLALSPTLSPPLSLLFVVDCHDHHTFPINISILITILLRVAPQNPIEDVVKMLVKVLVW
jgi:hypothetical protein